MSHSQPRNARDRLRQTVRSVVLGTCVVAVADLDDVLRQLRTAEEQREMYRARLNYWDFRRLGGQPTPAQRCAAFGHDVRTVDHGEESVCTRCGMSSLDHKEDDGL